MEPPSPDQPAKEKSDSSDRAEADRIPADSDSPEPMPAKPLWVRHPGWLLLGIGFLVYMVIVPTITMVIDWFTPAKTGVVDEMTAMEWIRIRTVSGVVTFWFVCVGASIGSFLNVVIYRLPRSMPLLWPPSACGNCGTKLGRKDNIPILGWLRLGGRCRYCSIPISARYPIVESIVAFVFTLFFFRELLSGGANLPMRTPNIYNGIVWILLYTKWDLVSLYFFHTLLLCLLLAWGMINHDRFRVPLLAVIVSLVFFIGLASAFPHLNPTYRGWPSRIPSVPPSLLASITGGIAGWLIGWPLARLTLLTPPMPAGAPVAESETDVEEMGLLSQSAELPASPGSNPESGSETPPTTELEEPEPSEPDLYGAMSAEPASKVDMAASLALVGSVMGVESTIVVAAATLVLAAMASFCGELLPKRQASRRLPGTVLVFVSATLVLCLWRPLHRVILDVLPFIS